MCCGGIFKWFLKLSAFIGVKSHRLHLFGFSPLWAFKCGLKLAAWINLKSHWLHLFDLAPLCALKCLLKSPAWIHIGCVWFFSSMYFQMCPQLLTALTDHKKSIFTLQADPEKSRDFIFQNPGILINWKSRDPGIPGIPLGPAHRVISLLTSGPQRQKNTGGLFRNCANPAKVTWLTTRLFNWGKSRRKLVWCSNKG